MSFLPISKADMEQRNWEYIDILFVTAEAYVDHPSFGQSIITRLLEDKGYRVAVLSEPDISSSEDFKRFGEPRLATLISGGVIDSMVNNYTANRNRRRTDCYASKGKTRPDRAVIVYSQRAREAYKDVPIIIGGAEASMRRFAHYDYWQNVVRRSIIFDAKADLLVYGMGETAIVEIMKLLDKNVPISSITSVKGTAYISKDIPKAHKVFKDIVLPTFEDISTDKIEYAKAFKIQYEQQDPIWGARLTQGHNDRFLVCNPMADPLSEEMMDYVYSLPYERSYHPIYEESGGIDALKEVKFSVTSHRGCFGNCSFCSIVLSQGRIIQRRSRKSILDEIEKLTHENDFHGYIHDLSGPTSNFVNPSCKKQMEKGMCKNKQCLFPAPCDQLEVSHEYLLETLKEARKVPGVKKIFMRSGLRYDYLMLDKDKSVLEKICKYNVSGQLKVAPEHVSDAVLELMGKPPFSVYCEFKECFEKANDKAGLKQYLLPYFISGHPGATIKETIKLTEYLIESKFIPEQVQDFYPTPGSLSTCMYYTKINPLTFEKVYVPNAHDRRVERALLQFNIPVNNKIAKETLISHGRKDLADKITIRIRQKKKAKK
ncbi:MAG: YgiQ family radical SAM protein [Clostridiaceae bacterium]|nr:YgiQ family radical SAM protein [Clostridiaceae bacterium]